jgi:hypothetical protein
VGREQYDNPRTWNTADQTMLAADLASRGTGTSMTSWSTAEALAGRRSAQVVRRPRSMPPADGQVVNGRVVRRPLTPEDRDLIRIRRWNERQQEIAKRDRDRRWFYLSFGLTAGTGIAVAAVMLVSAGIAFLMAHWYWLVAIHIIAALLGGTRTGRAAVCTVTGRGNFTHTTH